MPKLSHTITVSNPNTGKDNDDCIRGTGKFFRMSMAHTDLESYFRINFALMQHHKYSLNRVRKYDTVGERNLSCFPPTVY